MQATTPYDERLERRARRRVGMKLGWYIHAGVYAVVNLMLGVLAVSHGGHWAIYPALGWGVGLAIHGIVVFVLAGSNLQQRMLESERRKLREEQGPW
jgi:hypothetical protein